MITAAMSRRAQELAAQGVPFVTATVVRAQRPTSVRPATSRWCSADGTIEGFVGGVCTEHSVRAYALKALRDAARRCCCGSCRSSEDGAARRTT